MKLLNIKLLALTLVLFSFGEVFSQNAIIPEVTIKDHKENMSVINIDCDYDFLPNKGIRLTAMYPEIRQTNRYVVSPIDYTPIGNFSEGEIVDINSINGDAVKYNDAYSKSINLPFAFCFYEHSYSKIIIGDNGEVSFNIAMAQHDSPLAPSNPIPDGLPKNSIFGVFHDMNNNKQIRYRVEGVSPNRRFIVNYDNLSQFGTGRLDKNSTSQIVLYETTNIIDVYIKDRFKNESTNSIFDGTGIFRKNAAIGLTNYDSSDGIAAPGRDTGNWEAHNEAWRFTPDGATDLAIQWLNEFDAEISGTRNSESILVYPAQNTKYKVNVTYNICEPVSVTNTIEVKFSQDFPTAKEKTTEAFCVDNGQSYTLDLTQYNSEINPDSSLSFSYFEDVNLTVPISYPENAYEFSSNKTVYIKVLKSGICYSVGKLNLRLNKRPVITPDQLFEKCDENNDGKETINLNSLTIQGLSGMGYKFFETSEAANTGNPEITNYTSYLLDVTANSDGTKILYLRVWNSSYNDPDCYTVVPFKIKLKKYVKVKTPDRPFLICHVTEGQLIKNYNLTQYESQLIDSPTNGIIFEYYTVSNYAAYSKIPNPSSAAFTMNTTIYIKATMSGYCDAYTQLTLAADNDCDGISGGGSGGGGGATGPGGPGGGGGAICDTNETSITVGLDVDYLKFYLQGNLSLSDITLIGFYDSGSNSLLTNTTPYNYTFAPPFFKVIQARYTINASGFETSVNFPVSASKKATMNPDTFDICDTYNDQKENIIIKSTYNPKPKWQIALENEYPGAIIHFFSTSKDLNNYEADPDNLVNTSKIITNINLINPQTTVYVYTKFYGCIYTHEINFNLVPVPEKTIGDYTVCDFNNDNKEIINIIKITNNETDIKNELTSTQVIKLQTPIRYYRTLIQAHAGAANFITNLTNFEINTSQMSLFARLNISDECPIIVEIKFQFTTSVALPVINNLIVCDINNDNQENININNALKSSDPNSKITFYATLAAAEEGNEASPFFISTTLAENYLVTVSPTPIYVRVYDNTTTCWKILPFTITLVKTPVLTNTIIKSCDFENDGKELLTVNYIRSQLIANNSSISAAMIYKFYQTQAEATEALIPLLNTFEATATNSIWVNISQSIGDCPIIEELKFNLIQPPILATKPLVYIICNNNTGNENGITSENVTLDQYKDDVLGFPATLNYTFTYYDTTENDAITGGNFGKVNSTYTITSFPKTIWVRVTYNPTGCFSIKPIFFEQTSSLENIIIDSEIIACSSGEMSKNVNLEDYPPQMIKATASLNDFDVSYHISRANAVNNITITLDITHYNVTSTSQIWLKFVNKTTGCYIIKKLSVIIYSTPKSQDIFPDVCDETDGKLDGNYIIPDLHTYRNQIILGEPNLNDLYTFTYYKNPVDAAAGNRNTVSNLNYTFTESDLLSGDNPDCSTYSVYARIDKKDNTGCFSVVNIQFQINKKVPVNPVQPVISECDQSDNDGKSNFDLTSVNDEISNTAGVNFKYYSTKEDAQSKINEIVDFNNWKNTTAYEHIAYARVNAPGYCDNIASVKLTISPYIKVNDYGSTICEFESDGKTKSTINLLEEAKQMTSQINNIPQYPNLSNDIDIRFYTSLSNAQNPTLTNSIPTSDLPVYMIPTGITEIWVRFQHKVSECFEIKKLTLEKLAAPEITINDHLICDDNLDDIYTIKLNTLDLSVPALIGNYEISYHETVAGAENNIIEIDKSIDYVIPVSHFPKIIGVRVLDKDKNCVKTKEITLTTNSKVPVNPVQPVISECDQSDNDGKSNFDLTSVNDEISNTAGVNFKYYSTKEDAQSKINEIVDFNNWKNTTAYEHIAYARVNAPGYCDNIASAKLTISPYIKVNDYGSTICEFESDGKTKSTINLLEEAKQMTLQINNIPQYPNLSNDIDIRFYTSLSNAQNPTLTNSIPISDLPVYMIPTGITEIWVRFQHKVSECFEIKKLTLEKLAAPKITVNEHLICDDNLDDIYTIKLNTLDFSVPALIGNYEISYHETVAGAENNIIEIDKSIDYVIPVSHFPKIIGVRVLDKDKNCVKTKEITLTTNSKVPVNPVQPVISECDQSDNDGKSNFDLTSVNDKISNTAGVNFKYYSTKEDAQSKINEIVDFNNWKNTTAYEHIVYMRVNAPGYCDNIASVKLTINPYIKVNDYGSTICEFESDGKTKSTINLLEEAKQMTLQINNIPQYPNLSNDIDIRFYTSLSNAQNPTLTNSIPTLNLSSYTIFIGITEIFVRFESITNKCFEIKKLTINKLKAPEITVQLNPFVCNDNNDLLNASVTLTPSNGNDPYRYSFDNGVTFFDTKNILSLDSEQSINYIVADKNGCTVAGKIEIPGYTPPTNMDVSVTSIYCNTPGGFATLTVKSITDSTIGATYTYELQDPVGVISSNTTGIFTELLPKKYQIKAIDNATKCYITKQIEVTREPEITVSVKSHTNISCYGENSGSIAYTVGNYITAANYTYTLTPNLLGIIPTQVNDVITYEGLASGKYTFTVTDAVSGCTAQIRDFFINQPVLPLEYTVTTTNISCNGTYDGKIKIIANGGTGLIKYAISPNLTQFEDKFIFNHLAPGFYTILIKDELGCIGHGPLTIEINEPNILEAKVLEPVLQETCAGDKNGAFSVAMFGGTSPYNISLNTENGVYTTVTGTQHDFTELSDGKYIVFIKDANGCLTTVDVVMNNAVILDPKIKIDIDCINNVTTNFVTVAIHESIINPNEVDYKLDDSTVYQPDNMFLNLTPGKHTITARHSNGCEQTTVPFFIDNIYPLTLTLAHGGLNEIVATATGGIGGYEYVFEEESDNSFNKLIIYKSGMYTVTVTDKNGCTATASRHFEYIDICIPNYFTPNGDGVNDTWGPGCSINYPKLTFNIFDRYGRTIGEYKFGQKWDGKYNGNELPSGDYWYVLKLNNNKDNREFVGHFTLYR